MPVFGVEPFTRSSVYKGGKGGSTGEDQKGPYGKEPEVTMFFISDCSINGWRVVVQASCSSFPGLQRQFSLEVGSRRHAGAA